MTWHDDNDIENDNDNDSNDNIDILTSVITIANTIKNNDNYEHDDDITTL